MERKAESIKNTGTLAMSGRAKARRREGEHRQGTADSGRLKPHHEKPMQQKFLFKSHDWFSVDLF